MRVGVVAAMPSELRPVAKRLGLRSGPDRRMVGRYEGVDVVAVRTGMGTAAAGDGTRRLLDAVAPDHVVVVGVAGGIAPGQRIADVLAIDVVIDGHTGAEYRPHLLAAAAIAAEGERAPAALHTADELIADPDRIAALRSTGVVALDMETAAVAAVCEERGCPWSVVRAVSDRFDDRLADRAVFDLARSDGSPDPAAVARFLLRHPGRIPGLVRLGRDFGAARQAAADALAAALGTLPAHPS
ncbi:MAG TPA: hypothetical protein VIL48_05020 [Acidimicrobiales bacterium]